ncbi:MAG: SDR family oxidoreductase [Methylovulum sp.]|nr:SDR family oxidoreductase [Methylovulum sp.]
MTTVLITGANRGLGLEFCKQYAEDGWRVIACCRQPEQASALLELARQYPVVQIEGLDVAEFTQIDALARKLSDRSIDVLINNAGVYGDTPANRFGHLDYQAWSQTLRVNTLSPVKMAEAFLSQLKASDTKLIVNISSLMGSMTDNNSGGSILYRSSKAALNAAMKSLALDLEPQSVGVLIFHPGWVKTDMGGPNALVDACDSISGMRDVIAKFSLDQSGCFVKYDGSTMPW